MCEYVYVFLCSVSVSEACGGTDRSPGASAAGEAEAAAAACARAEHASGNSRTNRI